MRRRWGRSSFTLIVSVALVGALSTAGTTSAAAEGARSRRTPRSTGRSTGDGAEVFRSLREAATLAVCAALADD